MPLPKNSELVLLPLGIEVMRSPQSAGRLDLKAGLECLAAKGITRLMVEGGPTLAAAFIAADLVDEAVLFHAPKIVGSDEVDALATDAMEALTRRLKQLGSEPVGTDRQVNYARE